MESLRILEQFLLTCPNTGKRQEIFHIQTSPTDNCVLQVFVSDDENKGFVHEIKTAEIDATNIKKDLAEQLAKNKKTN